MQHVARPTPEKFPHFVTLPACAISAKLIGTFWSGILAVNVGVGPAIARTSCSGPCAVQFVKYGYPSLAGTEHTLVMVGSMFP
jgi:hypothetical protein